MNCQQDAEGRSFLGIRREEIGKESERNELEQQEGKYPADDRPKPGPPKPPTSDQVDGEQRCHVHTYTSVESWARQTTSK